MGCDGTLSLSVRVHPEAGPPVSAGAHAALDPSEEHSDVVARSSEVLEAQEVRRGDVVGEDLDDLGSGQFPFEAPL